MTSTNDQQDFAIDDSSIDTSTISDYDEYNTNPTTLNTDSTSTSSNNALNLDEINKQIETLGNQLGEVQNTYIERYNSTSFTYRWARPININNLVPDGTLTYNIQVFDKSRFKIVFDQTINEASAALINKNAANYLFIKPINLTPATAYYVKIFATINENKSYSSSTNKLEVYTGPSKVRNLKIIRGKDNPATVIKGQWAPPNDLNGQAKFTYEVAIQAAPKKNHKWDANKRDTLRVSHQWNDLISGQKYFIRIKSKLTISSPITKKTQVLQSTSDIRFICTEPLPLKTFEIIKVLDNAALIKLKFVETFSILQKSIKGRPKVYVIDILSLGQVNDEKGFQEAILNINKQNDLNNQKTKPQIINSNEDSDYDEEYDYEDQSTYDGYDDISDSDVKDSNDTAIINPEEDEYIPEYKRLCKDIFLQIEEEKLIKRFNTEEDDEGYFMIPKLHPFCRYNITIRSAVQCTTGLRREDLVIASIASDHHIISTKSSLPARNSSISYRDNWRIYPPKEKELTENPDLKATVNYTFPVNFVNSFNGPIIAYAVEVIFVEESADYSDYDSAPLPKETRLFVTEQVGPRQFNSECSKILFPSINDDCPRWISKWILPEELDSLYINDKKNVVSVTIGDLTESYIPNDLINIVEYNQNLTSNTAFYKSENLNLENREEHSTSNNSSNNKNLSETNNSSPSLSEAQVQENEITQNTDNNLNDNTNSNFNNIINQKPEYLKDVNPLDQGKSITIKSNIFQNLPLPEGYEYYFMALACSKVGCVRGIEKYWMATKQKVPRSAFIEKTKLEQNNSFNHTSMIIILSIVLLIVFTTLLMFIKNRRNQYKNQSDSNNSKNKNNGNSDDIKMNNKNNPTTPPSSDNEQEREKIPKKTIPCSKPIKISQFCQAYQRLISNSEILLSEEFNELAYAGQDRSCFAAQRDANRQKNRYTDVLPYDITRVKIHTTSNDPDSSYINANHVAGFMSDKEWIVTQGPLSNTIEDFWWLVWEYDTKNIIMLCNPIEKGKIKKGSGIFLSLYKKIFSVKKIPEKTCFSCANITGPS